MVWVSEEECGDTVSAVKLSTSSRASATTREPLDTGTLKHTREQANTPGKTGFKHIALNPHPTLSQVVTQILRQPAYVVKRERPLGKPIREQREAKNDIPPEDSRGRSACAPC